MVYLVTCHIALLFLFFLIIGITSPEIEAQFQSQDIDIVVERAHIYSPWLLAFGDMS